MFFFSFLKEVQSSGRNTFYNLDMLMPVDHHDVSYYFLSEENSRKLIWCSSVSLLITSEVHNTLSTHWQVLLWNYGLPEIEICIYTYTHIYLYP